MKRLLALAGGALLICAAVGCAPTNMLLVTQYGEKSPRVADMSDEINAGLKVQNVPYILRVYNTDLVGRVSDIWREEASRMAVVRLNSSDPAVVFVAGDDAACYFAQKIVDTQRRFIFLDIYGAPAAYKLIAGPQCVVTGVVPDLPVEELFTLMKQLAPSARGAAVLSDDSLQGNAIIEKIQAAADLPIKVTLVQRAHTLAEWTAAVQDIQTKADVLVIASCLEVREDAQSEATVPEAGVLRATARANHLPDFSFFKEMVGPNGVLGAVTVPVAEQAKLAVGMAVRALHYEEDLRNMPVVRCNKRETILSADRAEQLGVTLPGVPPTAKPTQPEAVPPAEPGAKPQAEPSAKPEATPPAEPAVKAEPAPPAPSAANPTKKYTVQAGDSLGSIAKKVYGDARKWKVIYDANKDVIGANPDRLKAKTQLVIPDIAAAEAAPAKAAPTPPEGK